MPAVRSRERKRAFALLCLHDHHAANAPGREPPVFGALRPRGPPRLSRGGCTPQSRLGPRSEWPNWMTLMESGALLGGSVHLEDGRLGLSLGRLRREVAGHVDDEVGGVAGRGHVGGG